MGSRTEKRHGKSLGDIRLPAVARRDVVCGIRTMETLSQLPQPLASSVVTADPADLPALARVHEQLLEIQKLVSQTGTIDQALADQLRQTAGNSEKLVERIILREVEDASLALQQVSISIAELQKLVRGASVSGAAAPSGTQTPASAPIAESPQPRAEATVAISDSAVPVDQNPINPEDAPLVQEFITESLGHIEAAEAAVLKLEEDPRDTEALNAIFRSFHTIKGVAGFLNLRQIGALAHSAESLLDLARKGKKVLTGSAVDVVLEAIDLLKVMIESLRDALRQNAPPAAQPQLPALLESLRRAAADEPPETAPADSSPPGKQSAAGPQPDRQDALAPAPKRTAATSDATVKVSTERLDALINMVGELVIAQSMVSQDVHDSLHRNLRLARNMAHLGKITRELQDLSMSMRMVPINGVFQKMARLVRDLARKAMKEVEFAMYGSETELDRNVVEAISDPLVHMVRNAVDHGVEGPEERLAAGKPRAGRIELRAYHQAGNIVIEISDDGRGLNKDKILRKAIDAGLVRPGQELSEEEIYRLIFHAGLSTAERITDVSGRGVGMDVVKRNVEALRGRVEIASRPGRGSTFTIRLPLTLAVIDGQIVRVGKERYIIPITSIEQSVQLKAHQLSTVQNRGEMCMVRSQLLPVVRLHRLFGVKPDSEDATESLLVIVQDDRRRCCLLVDELMGQQQVVIKSLGETLGHVPGISGGAILGDGNVSLILDIPGLMQLAASA